MSSCFLFLTDDLASALLFIPQGGMLYLLQPLLLKAPTSGYCLITSRIGVCLLHGGFHAKKLLKQGFYPAFYIIVKHSLSRSVSSILAA